MQENTSKASIGSRLRWLLDIEGRSIRDLEKASGIGYRTLQKYLSDERKPGAEHLKKLAESGINLHWLLLGYEEPAIRIIFPDMEPLRGPLAANSELGDVFLKEAMNIVDEFREDCLEKDKITLSTLEIIASIFIVFGYYDNVLYSLRDEIVNARKKGVSYEELAQFILTGPVRDRVRNHLLDYTQGIQPEADAVSD